MIGGMRDGTGPSGGIEFLQDGAAYDPAHRRWRRIPDAPGCPAFGTWTGTELVVGGNCANTTREYFMAAYDPARNAWTRLPSHAVATQLVAAGGRVFAWTGDSGPGAVLDTAARQMDDASPASGRRSATDSFATAYNGHLAVVGLLQRASEARDIATVDIFDADRRTWRHYESQAVTAAIAGVRDHHPCRTSSCGRAGWTTTAFLGPPASARPVWSHAADSPVELGATGESLVPIGPGRFFVWGGMLASHGNGRTQPADRTEARCSSSRRGRATFRKGPRYRLGCDRLRNRSRRSDRRAGAAGAVRRAGVHDRDRLLRVDCAVPLRGLLARPRLRAGRRGRRRRGVTRRSTSARCTRATTAW